MEFQYYGNFERQPRMLNDQPWWDEEDNLTDRHLNGKIVFVVNYTELPKMMGAIPNYQSDLRMSLDEGRQSQRPYRYGMVLLCAGALINWLGLAEDYAEPVRYVGVACIVAGALLICAAMCCWLQSPARQPQNERSSPDTHQIDDPIHVISMPDEETMQQKPPDYDTVAGAPPTYDDAIKLNPARLLPATSSARADHTPNTPNDVTIIPGQLDEALTSSSVAPVHSPIPKTPPPPYRPPQAIR